MDARSIQMIIKNDKLRLVKLLLTEIAEKPDNPYRDIKPDNLVFKWFYTGRQDRGLRLREEGKQVFEYAEIAHYDFPVETEDMNPFDTWAFAAWTIKITKKMTCPFYIGMSKERRKKDVYIRIYDHKIAMMITLYGTFGEYIESRN